MPRWTTNLGNEDALRQAPMRVSPTYTASLGRLLLTPAHRSAKSPGSAQHVWFTASLISSQSPAYMLLSPIPLTFALVIDVHDGKSTWTLEEARARTVLDRANMHHAISHWDLRMCSPRS